MPAWSISATATASSSRWRATTTPPIIEPYQGAATGVGGILRDVFTMGARPIAAMNALRFGAPDHPKTRHLVAGVVSGVGGYGNAFGVPTVGGEVDFDRPLQRQHPGQRLRGRPCQDRCDLPVRSQGRRPAGRLSRRQDRPRRRRRRHHGLGRVRRRRSTRSARPCRSATPSPKNACSKPASN